MNSLSRELLINMKFELEDYHRNITNDELIVDLKKVATELGRDSITRDQYDEHGKYSRSTFERRFGSWHKSLEIASLKKTNEKNISDEDLFSNLEEIWIKLGKQPRYSDIQKPLSRYSTMPYTDRFGTYRKALEEFVNYVNKENLSSSEEEIMNLKSQPLTRHKTSRDINWRLRFIVMRRDNFKCKNCGRSPATDPKIVLHVDHKEAWANGGETILENLQTLCSVCNIGKSDLE
jgi:5-methylcytosine-specific restriction endonuclease McrA